MNRCKFILFINQSPIPWKFLSFKRLFHITRTTLAHKFEENITEMEVNERKI